MIFEKRVILLSECVFFFVLNVRKGEKKKVFEK